MTRRNGFANARLGVDAAWAARAIARGGAAKGETVRSVLIDEHPEAMPEEIDEVLGQPWVRDLIEVARCCVVDGDPFARLLDVEDDDAPPHPRKRARHAAR